MVVCKLDLWCTYCGAQDFNELSHSSWECTRCHAVFEDNPGYGYFTSFWGDNDRDDDGKYSINTGELLDDGRLPRTPEGILRHSDTEAELMAYLERTQVK